MKNNVLFKLLIVAMAAILLCASFVSCAPSDENTDITETNEDTSATADESIDGDSNEFNIVENGKSSYTIIYPDGCDTYIETLATDLRRYIRDKTRANVNVVSDGGATPTKSSEYEILIGKTNREESKKAYDKLDYNGAKATVSGKKIVLAAHNSEQMNEVMSAFKKQIRISKDAKTLTLLSLNFSKSGTYAVKKLTLGGNDAWNFAIVASGEENIALANNINTLIGKASGVYLDIVSGTDALLDGVKPWFIGSTVSVSGANDTYYEFGEANGGFALWCPDAQSRTKAYSDFQAALDLDSTNTLELTDVIIPSQKQGDGQTSSADLKIMTFNVLNGWNTSNIGNRDDKTAEQILAFTPDVLGLQEFDDYYRNASGTPLTELISEKYSEVNAVQKSWNPIFYNKNTVTLLVCGHEEYSDGTSYNEYYYQGVNGTKFRTITWALFEHKESGKQFLVFNTHLDVESNKQPLQVTELKNKISELQVMFGLDNVFLMGDLNSNVSSEAAKALFNFGFKDTHDLAEVKDDLDSAGTKDQPIEEKYSSAIDHLYCIGDNITVSEYKTVISVRNISDHCPIQITLKIN